MAFSRLCSHSGDYFDDAVRCDPVCSMDFRNKIVVIFVLTSGNHVERFSSFTFNFSADEDNFVYEQSSRAGLVVSPVSAENTVVVYENEETKRLLELNVDFTQRANIADEGTRVPFIFGQLSGVARTLRSLELCDICANYVKRHIVEPVDIGVARRASFLIHKYFHTRLLVALLDLSLLSGVGLKECVRRSFSSVASCVFTASYKKHGYDADVFTSPAKLVANLTSNQAKRAYIALRRLARKQVALKRCLLHQTSVRGGLCLQPTGKKLKEAVYEFDVVSMYPSCIVECNLGPLTTFLLDSEQVATFERKFPNCVAFSTRKVKIFNDYFAVSFDCDYGDHHTRTRLGPLRSVLAYFLTAKNSCRFPVQKAIYKYLANFAYGLACKNSLTFGGKLTALATCAAAREKILDVIDICVRNNFEVVYGDTDSVFVRDFEREPRMARLSYQLNNLWPETIAFKLENAFEIFVQRVKKRYFGITKENVAIIKGCSRENISPLIERVLTCLSRLALAVDRKEHENALDVLKKIVTLLRINFSHSRPTEISSDALMLHVPFEFNLDSNRTMESNAIERPEPRAGPAYLSLSKLSSGQRTKLIFDDVFSCLDSYGGANGLYLKFREQLIFDALAHHAKHRHDFDDTCRRNCRNRVIYLAKRTFTDDEIRRKLFSNYCFCGFSRGNFSSTSLLSKCLREISRMFREKVYTSCTFLCATCDISASSGSVDSARYSRAKLVTSGASPATKYHRFFVSRRGNFHVEEFNQLRRVQTEPTDLPDGFSQTVANGIRSPNFDGRSEVVSVTDTHGINSCSGCVHGYESVQLTRTSAGSVHLFPPIRRDAYRKNYSSSKKIKICCDEKFCLMAETEFSALVLISAILGTDSIDDDTKRLISSDLGKSPWNLDTFILPTPIGTFILRDGQVVTFIFA